MPNIGMNYHFIDFFIVLNAFIEYLTEYNHLPEK